MSAKIRIFDSTRDILSVVKLKIMKKLFFFFALTMLISCGNASYSPEMSKADAEVDYYVENDFDDVEVEKMPRTAESSSSSVIEELPDEMIEEANSDDQSTQREQEVPATKVEKKIIRTANMSMEVEKYEEAKSSLSKLVEEHNAFVSKESENNDSYSRSNNTEIRIAPEKFDDFIVAVESLAMHVDHKTISAKDVTAQFVDMETRLASKRAVVDQYNKILKSAKNVQEILAVQNQLRRVVEEIESIEGQLKFLRYQVQFSTLVLNYYESFERPTVRQKSFWNRMGKALGNGWQGFQMFLVGLVSIWPFVLIFGLLGFWIVRRVRRRKR